MPTCMNNAMAPYKTHRWSTSGYLCLVCNVLEHVALKREEDRQSPMTPDEVAELLKASMHKSLCGVEWYRVLATLAEWEPLVRAVKAEGEQARAALAIIDAQQETD